MFTRPDQADRRAVQRVLWHSLGLVERGWVKRTLSTPTLFGRRRYCALGAILHSVSALGYGAAMRAAARAELERAIGVPPTPVLTRGGRVDVPGWVSIPAWNDARGRRKREVVAAFAQAVANSAPDALTLRADAERVETVRVFDRERVPVA